MSEATRLYHGGFESGDGFQRVRTLCRRTRGNVPKRPRGSVHNCFSKQRRYIEIIAIGFVDLAHRGGIVIVPYGGYAFWIIMWIALGQGADQRLFDRTCLIDKFNRRYGRGVGRGKRLT